MYVMQGQGNKQDFHFSTTYISKTTYEEIKVQQH